jgi:hypothetical protein
VKNTIESPAINTAPLVKKNESISSARGEIMRLIADQQPL